MDLFHRLNVLAVTAPPLSARRDDIGLLVEHFVRKYSATDPLRPVAPSFVSALREVDLPGNVRQLENLVRTALVRAPEGEPLGVEHLPADVWSELSRSYQTRSSSGESRRGEPTRAPWTAMLDANAWNLTRSLDHCERQFLQAALMRAHGNQSETARLLGLTPRSIYNKMRKHRLAG
jgi:DNA-binding NtrC family response regulator